MCILQMTKFFFYQRRKLKPNEEEDEEKWQDPICISERATLFHYSEEWKGKVKARRGPDRRVLGEFAGDDDG